MTPRREHVAFVATLAALVLGFFSEAIFGGKALSSGDVVFATASFGDDRGPEFEPRNRLLMDPVLQFAPWLDFDRAMIREGRLPTWNPWSGCGAPHLANGQSAIFDPFKLLAYLGPLPDAVAWMAAARLFMAGWGMFRLARAWQFGPFGRWFAGLTFPFCGFLVAWLFYPNTSVAVWLPWLFLATDRCLESPRSRTVAGLGLVAGLVLLGGQVQASAHVFLMAGVYAVWRRWARSGVIPRPGLRAMLAWSAGMALGVSLAAIEVVPLAVYLAKSPVWSDRKAEARPVLAIDAPRLLDAACTALPYAFGSQRRGHPHLGRGLGVHNLNESAGGFAGLATLAWLAPWAWTARGRHPRVRFLAGMVVLGGLGAFQISPVSNLLRAVPVLDVADHRRLTLWVAFGLCLLGGIGLDALPRFPLASRWWSRTWLILAALSGITAGGIVAAEPWLRQKAIAHYARVSDDDTPLDPAARRNRAERQVRHTVDFLPRYYALAAGHLALLAGLGEAVRRRPSSVRRVQVASIGLTLIDLFAFGFGLNPAIPRAEDKPDSAVIDYLRREVPPPLRVVAVGAELPPNLLMRYGIADARNYDSIELSRSLDWFDAMYEPEPDRPSTRSSRRTIRWSGIARAKEHLQMAGVVAVVGATEPPDRLFDRVDRAGRVWIGRWESLAPAVSSQKPGEIRVDLAADRGQVRWVAETYDPGWKAEIDGRPVDVSPHLGTFLGVPRIPPGSRQLIFRYEPREVRWALGISISTMGILAALAAIGPIRKIRTRALADLDGPR